MSFTEILDAVSEITMNDRIELSEIIQKKLIEEKRTILASEIYNANEELKKGNIKIQSVDEIMDDILYEI